MLAWIAAVVSALVTARVVSADLSALHRRARALGADVAVVLAAHDLPVGTIIDRADLRTTSRPASLVAADALRRPADAIGRVVRRDVLQQDVLRGGHLAPAERRGLDGVVPTGRRAIHVPTGAFRPPAGAIVDVLASLDRETAPRGSATVVARGARVVQVDPPSDSDPASGEPGGGGVILLATEAEAREIAYAASNGELTVVLAPPETACCTSSEP
jgi:Flp pilus assembly protein CpaB